MTLQQQIAAVLRGLTFDGEKGLLVRTLHPGTLRTLHPESAGGSPEGVVLIELPAAAVQSVTTDPLSAETLDHLARALRRQAGGGVPQLVEVSAVGDFAIGRSIDELDRIAGSGRAGSGSQADAAARKDSAAAQQSSFAGKLAVVTGGAQGFGAEIARMLCAVGATVVVADLNADGAATAAQELNARSGRRAALSCAVDVSDEASVEAMMSTISAEVGGIDLFVSNAGVLKAGSVTTLPLKDFEFVTQVNYTGFFLCTKHAAPLMALQWRAARAIAEDHAGYFSDIIQINSKSGLEGSNKNAAYAGAKFGGIGLVQSFAKELVSDGIKVNAICPGNFFEGPLWSDPDRGLFTQYLKAGKVPGATSIDDVKRHYEQQVPMGRGCRGEDVVRAILYAVEQKYETGQAIPVTGGQVMLS
ncbi:MAG: SDR family NAD(P)-dependent oxidoreductase [Spirochaetaceae bacterium]|nr:MAG: SDR family NAD(P)-dependent oxidoreductase [Spirochaetaceae bacterium]